MILYENKRDIFYAERRRVFTTNPHLHHHIELLYVSQGEVRVTINDQTYLAGEGDVVFVFPNQIHSFEDLTPIRGHIIIAPPNDFPEFVNLFKSNLPETPVCHPATKEIHHLFRNISTYMQKNPPYFREIVRGYSLALIGQLLPALNLRPQNTLNLSLAQQVLLYCDEHYTEPLSLDQLSRQFGVSRFYISHIFSDKIKVNFNNYLHMLRIQTAKQLLRHDNRSVTEIAYAVGYNNIRSFNRHFFTAVGATPSDFRRTEAE